MSPLNNLHGRVLVVNGRGAAPAVVARESVGADPDGGFDAQAGGCRTRVGQGHPRGPWMTSAARVVQICHKDPDRAEASKANRWYSGLLLAVDPGPGCLCGRFGQLPASDRPRSPTRPTAPAPRDGEPG